MIMKHLLLLLLFVASFLWGTGTIYGQSCTAIDADKLTQPMIGRQLFLWGQRGKFWPQHSTLRVRFMDGTPGQQARAWQRFEQIDRLINLTFIRVLAPSESELRVAFRDRNPGHWSYLGKDCLTIRPDRATMNLQLTTFDSASEWDRVALHEILHAIGFDHEQAHPSAQIPWNREAVYREYGRTQGWSRAQVDRQVLNRYSGTEFMGSAYDKDSIMQYPIPRNLVRDARYAVGWNGRLSRCDVATLERIYPTGTPLPAAAAQLSLLTTPAP
jgi:hypothetical protein